MKLELKYLVPYLPYGLRIKDNYSGKIDTIRSISQLEDYDSVKIAIGHNDSEHIWMFKPILRPLSDLDNEIVINGEEIRPLYKISAELDVIIDSDLDIELDDSESRYSRYFPLSKAVEVYDKLMEWHFDVFGLIENNLAIDINTLKS